MSEEMVTSIRAAWKVLPSGWLPVHGQWRRMMVRDGNGVHREDPQRRGWLATAHGEAVRRVEAQAARLAEGLGLRELHSLPDDPPALMRYGPGDGFGWHADVQPSKWREVDGETMLLQRKVGWSLQLSEPDAYGGGDLQFAGPYLRGEVLPASMRDRGCLAVFASTTVHRVAPVTQGERLALVGWLYSRPWA